MRGHRIIFLVRLTKLQTSPYTVEYFYGTLAVQQIDFCAILKATPRKPEVDLVVCTNKYRRLAKFFHIPLGSVR